MKHAFAICYAKDGVELQRYTISALSQVAAEAEADARFERARPELSNDPLVSRRVERL
jgi:hypothetical protein